MATIGLLHPGEMGSALGAAAQGAGARVVWASEGRSGATRARAEAEGLEDVAKLAALLAESDVVISVCPPHAAQAQAREVASAGGFPGVYVDANAIAPASARAVGALLGSAGARFVDGGIVGPPPRRPGLARLYLSGEGAGEVAALFAGSHLEAIPIPGGPGAASALKVCFAAWTKGTTALLAAIRALAVSEGVEGALLAEWSRSLPELADRSEGGARAAARKAWRFVGEMEEIASAFAGAGLPDGFHRASAEIFARLEGFKDVDPAPDLEQVVARLLRSERG